MAVFAISFRIDNGFDHPKRWQSVVDAIKKEAIDGDKWEETTSFFLIKSNKTAAELLDSIYYGSDLNESRDVILVLNTSFKDHAHKGAKYPYTLNALLDAR